MHLSGCDRDRGAVVDGNRLLATGGRPAGRADGFRLAGGAAARCLPEVGIRPIGDSDLWLLPRGTVGPDNAGIWARAPRPAGWLRGAFRGGRRAGRRHASTARGAGLVLLNNVRPERGGGAPGFRALIAVTALWKRCAWSLDRRLRDPRGAAFRRFRAGAWPRICFAGRGCRPCGGAERLFLARP